MNYIGLNIKYCSKFCSTTWTGLPLISPPAVSLQTFIKETTSGLLFKNCGNKVIAKSVFIEKIPALEMNVLKVSEI